MHITLQLYFFPLQVYLGGALSMSLPGNLLHSFQLLHRIPVVYHPIPKCGYITHHLSNFLMDGLQVVFNFYYK